MNYRKECYWEHFPHEADIGIRGYGNTIEMAFSQAATAMMAAICDVSRVKPMIRQDIYCEAPDHDLLLVDWLNELVYVIAVKHMLFSQFDVNIENSSLKATAWGEPIDISRHQPAVEVKGATYTELKVNRDSNGKWMAQCVIDV